MDKNTRLEGGTKELIQFILEKGTDGIKSANAPCFSFDRSNPKSGIMLPVTEIREGEANGKRYVKKSSARAMRR